MSTADQFPEITVRPPIRLGQFLKLAGLAEDGVDARLLVQEGEVTVNGSVDTRRGRQLVAGDLVEVATPTGTVGARVVVAP